MALCWHSDLPDHSGVARTGSNLQDMIVVVIVRDKHGEVVKTGPRGHVMTFPFCDSDTRLKPNHRY